MQRPHSVTPANNFKIVNNTASAGTITFTKTGSPATLNLYYSTDGRNFNLLNTDATTTLTLPASGYVEFKGNMTSFAADTSNYWSLKANVSHNVSGNIMSLVGNAATIADYAFNTFFNQDTNLVDASQLLLPALTLAQRCYRGLFRYCSGLTAAPNLPATTLAANCYQYMFQGTSLTTAPNLPALALASQCYDAMFHSCTSLVTGPVIAATDCAYYRSCYEMFYGCANIRSVTAMFTNWNYTDAATNASGNKGWTNRWFYNARNNADCTFTCANSTMATAWKNTRSNASVPSRWTVTY